MITAEIVRQLFIYDGEHLRWNVSRQKIQKGAIAGEIRDGYRRIGVNGQKYAAHRLIWLFVYGQFPTHFIDHIDGNGLNNRIENLRDVTNRENCLKQKLHCTNTSGYTGVSWDKRTNRWIAEIRVRDKKIRIGSFKNIEDAAAARKDAEKKHGFHPDHGKRKETPQSP